MCSLTVSSAGQFPLSLRITPGSRPYISTPAPLGPSTPLSTTSPTSPLVHIASDTSPTPQPSFFSINNNPHSLPTHVLAQVNLAIHSGWSRSTINRYSGAIRQFITFCDSLHIPQHLRFPADEFLLCAFAASSSGKHAGGTSRARLTALKAWHIAHNLEWKGSSRLRYVLSGVQNLAPKSSKRPPRLPVSATMLSQLITGLDLNLPLDAAVAACACTAFWGQCRLGELLPISSSTPLTSSFPVRSGFKRSLRNPDSCVLNLPHTKTHPQGEDIVLVEQNHPINPISLLKNHIRVNNISKDGLLFTYGAAGLPTVLTKSAFLRRCNDIWQPLGYPRMLGHAFRIGGTTELLTAGTPPDVVKATGRWSSESFLRYWRSLEDIAPHYIRKLPIRARMHNRFAPSNVRG